MAEPARSVQHEAQHGRQMAQPNRPRAPRDRNDVPGSSIAGQLQSAQGELQTKLDARLQQEIKLLTTRYGGDTALAERVARGRMNRNFAASDPDFAGEIAPIQSRIADLEEQVRKATQRRAVGTIGGSAETLG